MDRRFSRQVRLAEVGADGQSRLEKAEIAGHHDEAVDRVLRRYAERAGMKTAPPLPDGPRAEMPAWVDALRSGPREVASGAYLVLCTARRALHVNP